jgi:hypothetical chaperone protein
MQRGTGFDFGTTNSALAVADHEGRVTVAEFENGEEMTNSFRSAVFFGRSDDGGATECLAGPRAILRYLEFEEQRRLMQSLKSFLASRSFKATSVFGRNMTLEDLIGAIVQPLKEEAEQRLGAIEPPLVIGRPVRFANAKDDDDERYALARLRGALWEVGFPEIHFEFEPVAAAYHYEQGLERDELVLIADFGGGTSDFCLLPVGPDAKRARRGKNDIIACSGVPIAGDAFDAAIIRNVVATRLGRGSLRRAFLGKEVSMPNWIYRDLERWHHLSFLGSRETMGFLHEALRGSLEPEKIEALIHVIDNNLGYELYRSVQHTKFELTREEKTVFRFEDGPILIEAPVARAEFEEWIAEDLTRISDCVDQLLMDSATQTSDVDRVFLTGGSAFVPAVRQIFRDRCGDEKLRGGGELVSVASGLALRARDIALESARE